MIYQSTDATCHAAAASNALRALGLKYEEKQVLEWEDRIRKGGDPAAEGFNGELLSRALAEGCRRIKVRQIVLKTGDSAFHWLFGTLIKGGSAVLFVDGDHWVAAVGVNGNRILVADSGDRELVLSYEEDPLMTRWNDPVPESDSYTAILLERKSR